MFVDAVANNIVSSTGMFSNSFSTLKVAKMPWFDVKNLEELMGGYNAIICG